MSLFNKNSQSPKGVEKFTKKQKFIVKYLEDKKEPVTPTEISQAYGKHLHKDDIPESYTRAGAVSDCCKRLVRKGLINEIERGKYTL